MQKGDGWKWLGGGSTPDLDVEPSHQSAVTNLHINHANPCVRVVSANMRLDDPPNSCTEAQYGHVCVISYGGLGFGHSIGIFFSI